MASQKVPFGLQHADHFGGPLAAPVEVFLALQPIVVRVVLVADVEGRIGEGQIDHAGIELLHSGQAIAVFQHIHMKRHGGDSLRKKYRSIVPAVPEGCKARKSWRGEHASHVSGTPQRASAGNARRLNGFLI